MSNVKFFFLQQPFEHLATKKKISILEPIFFGHFQATKNKPDNNKVIILKRELVKLKLE